MKIKKFLQGLCIFYTIYSSDFVFARDERCVFETHSRGIEVAHIGDRQIYTLFANHLGEEEWIEVLDAFRSYNNYHSTQAQLLLNLNSIIEQHQTMIESEQSDMRKITRLLKSEQISWVGIEQSPEDFYDIDEMTLSYLKLKQELYDIYDSGLVNYQGTNQIFFLGFNALTITYANNPEIFNRVQIVPLEDSILRKQTERMLLERDQILDHISPFIDQGIIKLFSMSELVSMMSADNTTRYISNREFEDFLLETFETQKIETQTIINGIPVPVQAGPMPIRTPPTPAQAEAQMLLRSFIDKHHEFINPNSIQKSRNQKVVQSVLNQSGNGLIIFGTNHEQGIKEGLTTACQNGL